MALPPGLSRGQKQQLTCKEAGPLFCRTAKADDWIPLESLACTLKVLCRACCTATTFPSARTWRSVLSVVYRTGSLPWQSANLTGGDRKQLTWENLKLLTKKWSK